MPALRICSWGQVIPVTVGILLGICFVLLHSRLTAPPHPRDALAHFHPSPPPVRPLHLVAEQGHIHLVSQPQPKPERPAAHQRLDFTTHECALCQLQLSF